MLVDDSADGVREVRDDPEQHAGGHSHSEQNHASPGHEQLETIGPASLRADDRQKNDESETDAAEQHRPDKEPVHDFLGRVGDPSSVGEVRTFPDEAIRPLGAVGLCSGRDASHREESQGHKDPGSPLAQRCRESATPGWPCGHRIRLHDVPS